MKKLTANWGLKLASLIFAIIVWFLVTNINDPITSVRYTNIPVTLKNTSLITDQGQIYTVLDGSDTISSVTLYAPRSIIDSLSQSNIVATADIQELSSLNTIRVNVTTNKYSDKIENYSLSSDVVKLSIENKVSKSLALSATTSGTLADGYIIGDVTTEQNMVRISGPESVVNSVASATVDVDVTGFTSNIGTDADIELLDAEGNVVDSSQITMNIQDVRVNVVIYETKFVPISYTVYGEPASGYMYSGEIDSTPEQVLVAGRSSVISSLSEIKVDDENININGLSGDFSYTVSLKDYLPSGVIFGDPDFNGTAYINVHIDTIEDETFDVNIGNITIANSVEGFRASIDDSEYTTVSVTLLGLKETLDTINANDLHGTVDLNTIIDEYDLSELSEGTYSTAVEWDLPTGVRTRGTVSVYVTVESES